MAPIQPKDILLRVVNAQVALLPKPLRLKHGPLLVTVETWSDGAVQARWPETALHGEGTSDTSAIDALRDRLVEFARDMTERMATTQMGGPLLRQWQAFVELIDISGLAAAPPATPPSSHPHIPDPPRRLGAEAAIGLLAPYASAFEGRDYREILEEVLDEKYR